MHTLTKRTTGFFSYLLSYSIALAAVIFLSSVVMNNKKPTCNLVINGRGDSAVEFTPNLNLEGEFNYNTREVYVYLLHEAQNKNHSPDAYVIWDVIIRPWSDKKIYKKIKSNYLIRRVGKGDRLILKGHYFSYLGFMKRKTYAAITI